MIKIINITALIAVFVINLAAYPVYDQPAKKKQTPAVNFTLSDSAGNETSLSDFKGKFIILNFWATWCGPCMKEMPALEKINQDYKNKNVQVIGIAVVSKEQDIPLKIRQTGVSYPVLIGNKQLIADYGYFSTIPNTFIIDPGGKIVRQLSGSHNYADFRKELDALIAP